MKKITFLLISTVFAYVSCSKNEDSVATAVVIPEIPLTLNPIADQKNDTSSVGVYKGIIIEPSGSIEILLKHKDSITSAKMIIDKKEYLFTTIEINKVVRDKAIDTMVFVSGVNTFKFSVSSKGKNPVITGLKMDGFTASKTYVAKETSKAIVKGFEGTFEGDDQGKINFLTYDDAGLKGLTQKRDSTLVVSTQTLYGYYNVPQKSFFGTSQLLGNFEGTVKTEKIKNEDQFTGQWVNKILKGTFTAKRTF